MVEPFVQNLRILPGISPLRTTILVHGLSLVRGHLLAVERGARSRIVNDSPEEASEDSCGLCGVVQMAPRHSGVSVLGVAQLWCLAPLVASR